ncbi:hypothetical protein [Andreprevotia chitinilytica]|uniref:hypothetical protein n=1 Tax=Andreprevotia chitinilytica TaxID=396808 RepID=UPI000554491D|nr:hypothetical protein [Andreprevotia chitinilytica]
MNWIQRRFPVVLTLAAIVVGLVGCATQPPATTGSITVPLGSTQRVTTLFSYPNCLDKCPTPPPTLEATVEHYFNLSVQRDGYLNAQVKVMSEGGQVYAAISNVPADYSNVIQRFLKTGDLGYADAQKLKAAGKWQSDWYFFLPLGFAMRNNPTVQLLHFPPDTVMTQTQDYLQAATTKRWASLLTVNGVPPAVTFSYQTIVDIAPIAAPANAGSALEGVYDYFSDYTVELLQQWTAYPDSSRPPKPMVAFGGPARAWLAQEFKLPPVNVLTLTSIQPVAGRTVPVLGANHPSYIWYAADPKQYGGNVQKADEVGLKVMNQDLTASCWQANMGGDPAGSPSAALDRCKQKWPANSVPACELFYTSIRNLTQAQAVAKCTTVGAM